MEVKNLYYYFQQALSKENCKKIIELGNNKIEQAKKAGESTEAVTIGNNHKSAIVKKGGKALNDKSLEELSIETGQTPKSIANNSYVRDSEIAWLTDQWIYDLVYPFLKTANKNAGWNYDFSCSESFQFTKYSIGQFYGWHADGVGDHFGRYKRYIPGVTPLDKNGEVPLGYTKNPMFVGKVRKLSITINLNEPGEYEGGNLKFDFGPHTERKRFHECTEIRPQGSIIVFPSYVHHQVTPVTKGTRYSLVLWSLGPPFK
jgi:PKHD-type hydroxylase